MPRSATPRTPDFTATPMGRAFASGLPCQAPSEGDQPFASSPFAHPIPQNRRRVSADLFSGFSSTLGASAGIWSMTSIPSSICTLSRRRLSFGMSRVAELGNAGGDRRSAGKTKTGYHLAFGRHRLSLPLFFASSITDKRIQRLPINSRQAWHARGRRPERRISTGGLVAVQPACDLPN